MKPDVATFAGMHVELVRYPAQEARLEQVRSAGRPRLVLVAEGAAPPVTPDVLEDWVRLPVSEDDIRCRVQVLEDRLRGMQAEAVPHLDVDGLIRLRGRWVSLPPVEHRLTEALLERFRTVVSRDALTRAGWPGGTPDRNVLDVHIVRLRRRLAPLGLVIRTVRSRGYLLEEAVADGTTGEAAQDVRAAAGPGSRDARRNGTVVDVTDTARPRLVREG